MQLVWPVESWYLPATQSIHEAWPAEGCLRPVAHWMHWLSAVSYHDHGGALGGVEWYVHSLHAMGDTCHDTPERIPVSTGRIDRRNHPLGRLGVRATRFRIPDLTMDSHAEPLLGIPTKGSALGSASECGTDPENLGGTPTDFAACHDHRCHDHRRHYHNRRRRPPPLSLGES